MNGCFGSVKFCRSRFGRLLNDGVPDPGAENLITTEHAMRLRWAPVYRDGEEIQVPNGCGDLAINHRDKSRLVRWDVELELVYPFPELTEMLVGGEVIQLNGETIGYASPELGVAVDDYGVSIEAWSNAKIGDEDPSELPYIRWVFGKVKNWRFAGERELNNTGHVASVYSGEAYDNANFFDGPANDWDYISGRTWALARDGAPPAAVCGYQTLLAS